MKAQLQNSIIVDRLPVATSGITANAAQGWGGLIQ